MDQKCDFTIELFPIRRLLRELEHEIVVHSIDSPSPTLAKEQDRPDRQP
jgi:hypothetical protein